MDLLPGDRLAAHLLAGQRAALATLGGARTAMAEAGATMARRWRAGGRLVYAGAGSSGLMAAADAMELPGTFGLDPVRILVLMAGGVPGDACMSGRDEDDESAARTAAAAIRPGDAVMAVSASGRTPYTVTVARTARSRGAAVVAVANAPDAPVFDFADIAIHLPTPPELVAGSTRMGAATAQKAALNAMSTVMAVDLGHVHDGMTVNLRVDNAKLHARALATVSRVADVDRCTARAKLQQAGGAVKPAVLLAAGAPDTETALELLRLNGRRLRPALAQLAQLAADPETAGTASTQPWRKT